MKISLVLLALLTFACKEDDDKKSTETASWNADLLAPGSNLETPSAIELQATLLANSSSYMANDPTGLKIGDETDELDCFDELTKTTVFTGDDKSAEVNVVGDISECVAQSFAAEGITAESVAVKVKLIIQLSCSTGGLSAFVGQPLSALMDSDEELCKTGNAGALNYIEIDSAYKANLEGSVMDNKSLEITAFGLADGSPCLHEKKGDTWVTSDGCLSISRSANEHLLIDGEPLEGSGLESYEREEDVGLTETETSLWFVSGVKKMQYGDWKGTLTYSGADTAPSYELVNGSQTVSGTLSAGPGLRKPAIPRLKLPKFSRPAL